MLKIKNNIKGLDKLQKEINRIERLLMLNNDIQFQKFIQDKVLKTVNDVSKQRLPVGLTSEMYIGNNKIQTLTDGFIVYNDTYIETNLDGYDGKFCIALAFEYGTGLVGQENPKVGAWQYNVKNHKTGWVYFENGDFHFTRGIEGYEIYRFAREEILKNLSSWFDEYYKKVK